MPAYRPTKVLNDHSLFYFLRKVQARCAPYAVLGAVGSVLSGFIGPTFAIVMGNMYDRGVLLPRPQCHGEENKGVFVCFHWHRALCSLRILGATLLTSKEENLVRRRMLTGMIQLKSKYLHMHTLLRFLFHFFRRQLVQQPNSISFAIVVILRNEVGWFYEEENYSSLVAARRATDAAYVQPAIAERISVILQNITSLLTSFFVGFIIERRVALLILVTFPLLVLVR